MMILQVKKELLTSIKLVDCKIYGIESPLYLKGQLNILR